MESKTPSNAEVAELVYIKLEPKFIEIWDELKRISRRQESHIKNLEIIDSDIRAFEELSDRIRDLTEKARFIQDTLKNHTARQTSTSKDITQTMSKVKESVDDQKSMLIKTVEQAVEDKFNRFIEVVAKSQKVMIKPSLFARIKGIFKREGNPKGVNFSVEKSRKRT